MKITWEMINEKIKKLNLTNEKIFGVPKGGMIISAYMKEIFPNISLIQDPYKTKPDIIVDDLEDSGKTKQFYENIFLGIPFVPLFKKNKIVANQWIVFPWEEYHPNGIDTIEQNITRQLQYIGEDPEREGLKETPKRVVKSYLELFSGYGKNPNDILKTFDAETYDQIIILKNIELYSMCEHHMLPFIGEANVAYIPNKKVIGVSKLARLVDIYSRRLQIQERIGEQVTTFLIDELQAKGAACIITASHMCMRMRGCSKQNSQMVTSSLKGVFLSDLSARQELIQLLKN